MALNFPNNPSVGDIHEDSTSGFSFQWDGTFWKSYRVEISDSLGGNLDAELNLNSNDITGTGNINITGIVTATSFDGGAGTFSGDLSVSGNVSIGGTLTYEDVTNIDAVGVITARSGIHVTGGSVGIGTDNPGTKLDVRGGNWSNGDIVVGQIGNAGRINFRRGVDGGDTAYLGYDGATNNSQVALAVNSADGTILFKTNSKEIVRVEDNTVHIGDRSGNNNATHFGTSRVSICGPDPIGTTVTKANSYLAIGNNESELDGVYPITFGYTNNGNDYQPAYIAYKTTSSASSEKGDLLFGTRDVTTDTLPSERLRITSDGQVNISGLDGTLRNPSMTNIQRNGLILFPSSANGTNDYSDNHMFSIAQSQGSWLNGETGTNHSSWGPLWTYHNGAGGYQKRAGIHYDHHSTEQFKFWSSYGDFVFKTDTGKSGDETAETCDREAMRITYQGYVTKSGMPSFAAGYSVNSTTWNVSSDGWTKIAMDTERWDNRGNYDTSTSRFTAPVAGYYLFGCVLQLENPSYSGNPWMYINPLVNGSTSSTAEGSSRTDVALIDYYNQYTRTDLLELAAGDYVEYWRKGNLGGSDTIVFKGGSESYWWGYLVG